MDFISVQELSVKTFHFFAKSVIMNKSRGKVEIPSGQRHPTLTVEIRVTKAKQRTNTGFNEITVWIEE